MPWTVLSPLRGRQAQTVSMANGKHTSLEGLLRTPRKGFWSLTGEAGCKQTEKRRNQEYTAPGEQDREEVWRMLLAEGTKGQ